MNKLDDELAQATDSLLGAGNLPALSEENRQLGEVLRQLYTVIEPDAPPTPAFEARLTRMLNTEWERTHSSTLRLVDRPIARVVGLAAAIVLILAAVLVLAVPNSDQPLQGTAIGLSDGLAILVLLGVALAAALFYWRSRH